jgi:hypothetical protein
MWMSVLESRKWDGKFTMAVSGVEICR